MNKQKGLAPILIVMLLALAVGGYLIYTNYPNNRYKTTQQTAQPSPSSVASPITSRSSETIYPSSKDIKIIDGSVYQITQLREQQLLIDKQNFYKDYGDNFNFVEVNLSQDESKILLLGQGSISIYFLYYTPLNKINVKNIGIAEEAVWSHSSRYIVYTSKPADAGAVSILRIYDTKSDKEVNITNKPKIKNLDYDFLGFGKFQWLDDDSGIKVNYTAYKFKPEDPDPLVATYGAVVGEGEVILPLVINTQ